MNLVSSIIFVVANNKALECSKQDNMTSEVVIRKCPIVHVSAKTQLCCFLPVCMIMNLKALGIAIEKHSQVVFMTGKL